MSFELLQKEFLGATRGLPSVEKALTTLELCLKVGVDVNMRDDCQLTPLMRAADSANPEIAKALIKAGAGVDAVSSYGNTALILAVSRNHIETIKVLLDANAKVNIKNNYGLTALFGAASRPHPEILTALIDAGADINYQNDKGDTALFEAVINKNVQGIKLLIDAGADVFIKNNFGGIASTYASNPEILKLLRAAEEEAIKSAQAQTKLTEAIKDLRDDKKSEEAKEFNGILGQFTGGDAMVVKYPITVHTVKLPDGSTFVGTLVNDKPQDGIVKLVSGGTINVSADKNGNLAIKF